jgi:hypothetical protein
MDIGRGAALQRNSSAALHGADLRGAIIPATAFDAKESPRCPCDARSKRDGQLRQRLRGYCKGRHGTILLQAK